MPPRKRSKPISYLLAFLTTAAAVLLTLVELRFNPFIGYSILLVAVMLSAWYGGLGPGLLSTGLSALAIQFLVEPTPYHFYNDDAIRLAVFALAAMIISELTARGKHRQEFLAQFNEKLQTEVEKRTAEIATANRVLEIENARRKRALHALSTFHKRRQALFSVSPDLMFRMRNDGTLLEVVSGSPQSILPISKRHVGKHIDDLLPSPIANTLTEHANKALTARGVHSCLLMLGLDASAWREARIIACSKDEVLAIVRDVSELKAKEAALRRLTIRLTTAQDDERRSLARELHDEAGQMMTAITVGLYREQRRLRENKLSRSQIASELSQLSQLAGSTQEKLRSIAHALHPSVLEHLGLSAALQSFIAELRVNAGIEFQVDIPARFPGLSPEQESSFYRIAQEATTNAVRHSGARCISIKGAVTPDHEEICVKCGLVPPCALGTSAISLLISDDGRGFDCLAEEARGAYGLNNMRERAVMIGARVNITSEMGKGASVLICTGSDSQTTA